MVDWEYWNGHRLEGNNDRDRETNEARTNGGRGGLEFDYYAKGKYGKVGISVFPLALAGTAWGFWKAYQTSRWQHKVGWSGFALLVLAVGISDLCRQPQQ